MIDIAQGLAKSFPSSLLCLAVISAFPTGLLADDADFFLAPREIRRTKTLKDGRAIVAYHQTGMVTARGDGPFRQGALFAQGTMVKDADGNTVADVAVIETTDKDGDIVWGVVWRPAGDSASLSIKAGTGKWEGIAGSGVPAGAAQRRADGHTAARWDYSWELSNLPSAALRGSPDDYEFHDRGLSFHGPHIEELSRELDNGISLVVSNQSGVLLSDDAEAHSPRNFATCYDRGTTYRDAEGRNLGDVMLLEDTDPDGDVVWLYHEWWYGKGPGSYEFIGGTGKWKGISGYGITRGMLRERTDDHFMLKSEMHWNLAK